MLRSIVQRKVVGQRASYAGQHVRADTQHRCSGTTQQHQQGSRQQERRLHACTASADEAPALVHVAENDTNRSSDASCVAAALEPSPLLTLADRDGRRTELHRPCAPDRLSRRSVGLFSKNTAGRQQYRTGLGSSFAVRPTAISASRRDASSSYRAVDGGRIRPYGTTTQSFASACYRNGPATAFSTVPHSSAAPNMYPRLLMRPVTRMPYNYTQQRTKVYVSKHNNLNVTSRNIIDYCMQHGIHESEMRVTGTHVVIKECPFCNASNRPTRGKSSNQYKLYVSIGGGAYYCHRCGNNGSWFDFKLGIGGPHGVERYGEAFTPAHDGTGRNPSARGEYATPAAASSAMWQPTLARTGGSHRTAQNTNTAETVHCLPMPPPRIVALYSSMLLDMDGKGNRQQDQTSNKVLDYLLNVRGLTRIALRKYGVGRAVYKFPTDKGYQQADCVTFPWLVSVRDIKVQEGLRGATYVHSHSDNNTDGSGRSSSRPASTPSTASSKNRTAAIEGVSAGATVSSPAAKNASAQVDDDASLDSASHDKASTDNEGSGDGSDSEGEPETDPDDLFVARRIKVRALENKGWQRLDPAGGGWGLFGLHTVPMDCNEIIVTEGEYDAMAVWQATGRPAVSVPNGCRSLPIEILPLLERFDKVILWMDNDGPGQEGAEKIAKKIGLPRSYIVKCKDAKDANDALRMNLDLNKYIDSAERVQHDRILTFRDLRDEVLHEILNPVQYAGTPINSLPLFTQRIKGFRRGELTVFTGPTGSGKTTLLGQISVDLAEQGANCLWGSFEIKNTRLLHKLMQQYGRAPLPEAGSEDAEERLNALADRFEGLPLYFMRFHGGSDIDEVIDAMEYAVYVNDVECIILDNMQFMISRGARSGTGFDKYDVQDMAIGKFRKFATEHNIHVILVVHPRKEDEATKLGISSVYGSAKATQEADTVLILQSDGRRKYIEVKKNRFDGTVGVSPLYFDRKSGRYTEDEHEANDGQRLSMMPEDGPPPKRGWNRHQPNRPSNDPAQELSSSIEKDHWDSCLSFKPHTLSPEK